MEAATATQQDSGDAIFDAKQYDLPIPSQDGRKADKLVVSFSGQIDLDRTSEEDLAFIDSLEFLSDVELKITATVTKKGFSGSVGKDDAPDSTGYGVGLRVHSVETVDPR